LRKIFLSLGLCLSLAACGITAATPPQLPTQAANISRAALDFAFHSFDAGLYAFDLAMDLKHPAPGSDQAKAIAAAGRKVLGFLNAAEAARRAGNSASYEEAFANANSALDQFKALLGVTGVHAYNHVPATMDRESVLNRA